MTILAALLLAAAMLVAPGATGVVKVADFRADEGTAERKIFKSGGLRVRASCESDDIFAHAKTGKDDALLASALQAAEGSIYIEDPRFRPNDFGQFTQFNDSWAGQLIYAHPGGKITSLDWMAEDSGPAGADGVGPHGDAFDCAFHGIGRTVGPGSKGRVKFTKTEGTTETFRLGGLELRASCETDSGDAGEESDLTVNITTTHDNAVVHYNRQFGPFLANADYDEDDSFLIEDQETLVQPGDNDDSSAGQIVYSRPGGVNVAVDWAANVTADGDLLGDKDCAFVGTARKLGPGDAKRLNHRLSSGDPEKRFAKGGLRLISNCTADELFTDDLFTVARNKKNDAMIHFNRQGPSTNASYAEADDFDAGSANQLDFFGALGADDGLAGQLIYGQKNGKVVTVDWLAEESISGLYGGTKDCAFVGTADLAAP